MPVEGGREGAVWVEEEGREDKGAEPASHQNHLNPLPTWDNIRLLLVCSPLDTPLIDDPAFLASCFTCFTSHSHSPSALTPLILWSAFAHFLPSTAASPPLLSCSLWTTLCSKCRFVWKMRLSEMWTKGVSEGSERLRGVWLLRKRRRNPVASLVCPSNLLSSLFRHSSTGFLILSVSSSSSSASCSSSSSASVCGTYSWAAGVSHRHRSALSGGLIWAFGRQRHPGNAECKLME